jgi:hypothetical protein
MSKDDIAAKLAEKYPLNTFGLWEIRGEDLNCDLGGHHHMPLLTRVEGTYKEAIQLALSLTGFFSWGAGGSIEKVEFAKLEAGTVARLHGLQEKQKALRLELAEVEAELHRYRRKV